jgi:tetratricopeptide (TPR) repeat protein
MKHLIIGILLSLLLSACRHVDKAKENDYITDKYYSDYVLLYQAYGHVPLDSTMLALDRYLTQFPDNPKASTFKARVYLDMGLPLDAEHTYQRVLALKPTYSPALSGLGSLYGSQGKLDSAISLLSRSMAARDSSHYTPLSLAIVYYRKGDIEQVRHTMSHFAQVDTLDTTLGVYITAVQYAVGDSLYMHNAAALTRKKCSDTLLDSLLHKQINALAFFDLKLKSTQHVKH